MIFRELNNLSVIKNTGGMCFFKYNENHVYTTMILTFDRPETESNLRSIAARGNSCYVLSDARNYLISHKTSNTHPQDDNYIAKGFLSNFSTFELTAFERTSLTVKNPRHSWPIVGKETTINDFFYVANKEEIKEIEDSSNRMNAASLSRSSTRDFRSCCTVETYLGGEKKLFE